MKGRSIATLMAACVTPTAWGQASLTDLGTLPGDTESYAYAVSRDGQVVIGRSFGPNFAHAFRWSQAHGMEDLGYIPNASWRQIEFWPYGVSDDGTVVVGGDNDSINFENHGFRWQLGCGMEDLGSLYESYPLSPYTLAMAVSGDGQIVVGRTTDGGFRWDPVHHMQLVPGLIDAGNGRADAITRDGSAIVGLATNGVHLWRDGVGDQLIIPESDYSFFPHSMSDDALVVMGDDQSGLTNDRTVRWTSLAGVQHLPGPAQGGSSPGSLSADGIVTVGALGPDTASPRPCVWVGLSNPIDLNVYLPQHGVDLTGWDLRYASGVSADGTVISGWGLHNGQQRAWVVRLAPLCSSADFNHDGDIATDADIEAFFSCLAGNCCPTCYTADFNGDGDLATDADIEAFFRVLAGGNC
jgi:probable HAF family extracellular repeat protein